MEKKSSNQYNFFNCITALCAVVICFLMVYQFAQGNNTIQLLQLELESCKNKIVEQESALLEAAEQLSLFEEQVEKAMAEEEMTYVVSSTKEYAAWVVAQTAVEHTDLYNSMQYAYEQLLDLDEQYYDGSIKYRACLDLLVPEGNQENFSAYKTTLKRYLGASDQYIARNRFIEDLVSAELLVVEENGYYSWNRGTLTVDNVMNRLNVTEDVANAMLGLLRMIGWEV